MAAVPLDERVAMYVDLGMTAAAAASCAAAVADMGPSILALYRSAGESDLTETGRAVAGMERRPPMHVVIATDDRYTGGEALARRTAEAWDAHVHRLGGLGHWWMMQDPARAADVVRAVAGGGRDDGMGAAASGSARAGSEQQEPT